MKRINTFSINVLTFAAAILLISLSASAFDYVTAARRQDGIDLKQNPLAGEPFNWDTATPLPDATLLDLSGSLTFPAGRDGATTVTADGHFASAATGERLRFWGVTLGLRQADIPMWQIDEAVDSLARNGVNLIRITSLDDNSGPRSLAAAGRSGDDSQAFQPEVLERLDYWAGRCAETGIYIAIVLRDARQFRPRDGVEAFDALGTGARGAAIFDPRLRDLQIDFARRLLRDHISPFTGRALADEPALAFVQIARNDSLFLKKWSDLPEPYRTNLHTRWNAWLKARYKNSDELFKAWRNVNGLSALQAGESLEDSSVELPGGYLILDEKSAWDYSFSTTYSEPPRLRDALEFAIELHRDYYAAMRDALRGMGVRAPITSSGLNSVPADSWSIASTLDATIDSGLRPPFAAVGGEKGLSFDRDPLGTLERQNPPREPGCRWLNRPQILSLDPSGGEASRTPAALARMALLWGREDVDAVLWDWPAWPKPDRAVMSKNQKALWTHLGVVGLLFRSGIVDPIERPIGVAYSKQDLFVPTRQSLLLPRPSRVENFAVHDLPPAEWDRFAAVATSGRTHHGPSPEWRRAIIFSNSPYPDFSRTAPLDPLSSVEGQAGYNVLYEKIEPSQMSQSPLQPRREFITESVKNAGGVLVWPSFGGEKTRGFWDANRENIVLSGPPGPYLTAMAAWIDRQEGMEQRGDQLAVTWSGVREDPVVHLRSDAAFWESASAVVWARPDARQALPTSTTLSLTGAGTDNVRTATAMSLDGRPLVISGRGGRIFIQVRSESGPQSASAGAGADEPGRVAAALSGAPLIETDQNTGLWEMIMDRAKGKAWLRSTEPNVSFEFPDAIKSARLCFRDIDSRFITVEKEKKIIWPGGALYIEVEFEE